ncbi:T-cell surface glycoprotein CD3 zeta chain isoform X2 [Dicentrarchus labrax]|uniref:T-cell surface glycoprotein CD3 zeta chain isoform X2 n=1 Tax=Dicentrarchus labrax TaxID=13489 RepID=UPI0021F51F6E|nr:T-cell surface glycoprotein CD3 zeta chain isoform X2 [Dicentrarchus labrax]
MELQTWISGLLVLASVFPPAEALALYDPQLCYVLDGFLGLYGLIITGMFIREKFFRTKAKATDESIYSDLHNQNRDNPYDHLMRGDPERGRNRRPADDNSTYTGLTKKPGEGEYKELPIKRERHRKNEQVYQGLSTATKDTYDSLQMKPLSAR